MMLLLTTLLAAAHPLPATTAPSATTATATATVTGIETQGPQGALSGTMVRPEKADAPVVLIIPGSGPTDRDGNNPLGVTASTYRLIAEGLAQQGIASVRIDKRGMFGSAAAADANAVTIDAYADDTHSWVDAIRQETGQPCVWLLGHSEGGLVALASAARQADDICGLILAATPGRPVGDVMKAQLRDNPANAPLLDSATDIIDTLARGNTVAAGDIPAPLAGLFAPAVQGFLVSLFSYDPAQLAASVDRPILILQGARDLQVTLADADALAAAQPASAHFTRITLADTNHVLKSVTEDGMGPNFATYANPDLPLAPGVISSIAEFIGANSR